MVLTCCEAGCLFFTLVARGNRTSVSLALVPATPDILAFYSAPNALTVLDDLLQSLVQTQYVPAPELLHEGAEKRARIQAVCTHRALKGLGSLIF